MKRPEFRRDPELTGQMNDASISVTLNISEGFLRRRDKETMQFLRYSIASNGELRACFYLADGRHYITPAEAAELIELNERIAKMLRRWQGTLEDSGTPIRGPKPTAGSRTKDGPRPEDQEPGTDQAD